MSALMLLSGSVGLVQAQEGADLSATIREAILTDPRSSEMTETEIDAMVSVLAAEAEAQGVSSDDITWRPQDPATFAAGAEVSGETCGYAAFLCALNESFGFDGSDPAIPIGLGISSALLLFIIGSILLHIHGHHPFAGNLRREK